MLWAGFQLCQYLFFNHAAKVVHFFHISKSLGRKNIIFTSFFIYSWCKNKKWQFKKTPFYVKTASYSWQRKMRMNIPDWCTTIWWKSANCICSLFTVFQSLYHFIYRYEDLTPGHNCRIITTIVCYSRIKDIQSTTNYDTRTIVISFFCLIKIIHFIGIIV